MDCIVCYEKTNKSTRFPSTCPSCSTTLCRECIQVYLLQDENRDPICPNTECKKPWTQTFLYDTLTAKFRLGPYKAHREKILFDQQKARLPETQEDARRYKDALEIHTPIHEEIRRIRGILKNLPEVASYKQALKTYHEETADAWRKMSRDEYSKWRTTTYPTLLNTLVNTEIGKKTAESSHLSNIHKLYENTREADYIVNHYGQPYPYAVARAANGAGVATAPPPKEKRAFIMKCPKSTCEGFLSTQYKCGLCDVQICAHCHIEKTNEPHICDPETVETIKQIRKEAKPCPKCAALISKIDGCDQMWCTQCHTAFSWNTGQIETRVIHNPHFFQWMRATGQEVGRRDIPGMACAEVRDFLTTAIHLRIRKIPTLLLENNYRNLTHIREVVLRGIRHDINTYEEDEWRRRLRVQRLVGIINEDDWKDKLQRMEKAHYKQSAWYQLFDMYSGAGLEMFGRIRRDSTEEEIQDVVNQLKQIKEYVDNECSQISKLYGCVIPIDIVNHELKW